jgi:predicted transcriptional regulator
MKTKKKKYTAAYSVRFSREANELLDQLAEKLDLSRRRVLEEAIRALAIECKIPVEVVRMAIPKDGAK